jgi:hypothetical protein
MQHQDGTGTGFSRAARLLQDSGPPQGSGGTCSPKAAPAQAPQGSDGMGSLRWHGLLHGSGSIGTGSSKVAWAPLTQRQRGLLQGGAGTGSSKAAVAWPDDDGLGSRPDEPRSGLRIFLYF